MEINPYASIRSVSFFSPSTSVMFDLKCNNFFEFDWSLLNLFIFSALFAFKTMLVCINFEKMLLIFDKILIIFSHWLDTAQKMKFSIKDFFSKCNQIRRKLRTWSHFLKKSLMENFIFCAVWANPQFPVNLYSQIKDLTQCESRHEAFTSHLERAEHCFSF